MDAIEKENEDIRRLTWHSRRGMLELDVILLPFTEHKYRNLSAEDKLLYRKMIDCEDTDLFDWFMEKSVCPDPDINRMVNIVLTDARQG